MSHNGGYQAIMGGSLASFVNQTLQGLEAKEKDLRRVLFVVRAGVAKNAKVQCTRMKLLTQPAILTICLKSIDSF